ncbi:MAG: tryptophan--tRNA ligase [Patescibacteria group bacterium]
MKPIAFSGVQPSGNLHIGNYLGAIKQFVALQNDYQTFFCVVDLHAITEPQEPAELRARTLEIAAIYLASGLDPQKNTIFVQSQVPAHTELGWILNTLTPMGELERMTQFKEKSGKHESVLAGLFNYPFLMAADILLYKSAVVPVGEDQVQHLEFTRALARKFNTRFGETFPEPQTLLQKQGARIMGLDDPLKKMSKSASSPNNYIALLDEPEEIRRKIKIAVTDSGVDIKYNPEEKPAISNLLSIMSRFSDTSIALLEEKYRGETYREFKSDLAELVVKKLSPIRERTRELLENKDELVSILKDGRERARETATKTLTEVKEKVGLSA